MNIRRGILLSVLLVTAMSCFSRSSRRSGDTPRFLVELEPQDLRPLVDSRASLERPWSGRAYWQDFELQGRHLLLGVSEGRGGPAMPLNASQHDIVVSIEQRYVEDERTIGRVLNSMIRPQFG